MKMTDTQRERKVMKRLGLKRKDVELPLLILGITCRTRITSEIPKCRLYLPPWKWFTHTIIKYFRHGRGWDVVRDPKVRWPSKMMKNGIKRRLPYFFKSKAEDDSSFSPASSFGKATSPDTTTTSGILVTPFENAKSV